jgi:hypothetical protein
MNYLVIVGNIGTAYHGDNEKLAKEIFGLYKEASEQGKGRAACETVTLFEGAELVLEYVPISKSVEPPDFQEQENETSNNWAKANA